MIDDYHFLHFRTVEISYGEITKYLRKIQSDPSFKGALGRTYTKLVYQNLQMPLEKRFHFCKEVLLNIPIVMYTRKNFFLVDELNEALEAFRTAGLIGKWYNDDLKLDSRNEKELIGPKTITLHDVFGSFQILSFGLIASFIVFIAENSRTIRTFFTMNFVL